MGVLSMKDRLRRLLAGTESSKFRKIPPGVRNGADLLHDDSRTEIDSDDDDVSVLLNDPYVDVREEIEALSLRDRQRAGIVPCEGGSRPDPYPPLRVPTLSNYLVYIGYGVMIVLGRIYDTIRWLLWTKNENAAYAPLCDSWGNFYTRCVNAQHIQLRMDCCGTYNSFPRHFFSHVYLRVQDAFCRPLASSPGTNITVLERYSADDMATMHVVGNANRADYENGPHYTTTRDGSVARKCTNLGSYNYLGFGDRAECRSAVKHSLENLPVSCSSSRAEFGTTVLHQQLERTVANFLLRDDALVFSMGFNTNATTIPALMGAGDLILSDELNHTSIVTGARASGASIRVFPHDNIHRLEKIVREAVVMGRPRTRRPWNRIWILVEGIYSMEGEYCDLQSIVRVAKKYGAYIYLDEAHSIGAMGSTGRGVAEHCGVETSDIDVMMGTFTKSFGGIGGYIAANQDIVDYLRNTCAASLLHNSMSPTVCQQVISALQVSETTWYFVRESNGFLTSCLQVINGEDGTTIGRQKIQALRDNSNYFRLRLRQLGLHVLGQYDSPVVPVMLFEPGKIAGFSREAFRRGLAAVVVGFPAVPLAMARVRFCVSAGHTREQLDQALQEIAEVSQIVSIRYRRDDPQV